MLTFLSKMLVLLSLIASLLLAAYSVVSTTTYARDDLYGQIEKGEEVVEKYNGQITLLENDKQELERELTRRKEQTALSKSNRNDQVTNDPEPINQTVDLKIKNNDEEIKQLEELNRIAKEEYDEVDKRNKTLQQEIDMAKQGIVDADKRIIEVHDDLYQMLAKAKAAMVRAKSLEAQLVGNEGSSDEGTEPKVDTPDGSTEPKTDGGPSLR